MRNSIFGVTLSTLLTWGCRQEATSSCPAKPVSANPTPAATAPVPKPTEARGGLMGLAVDGPDAGLPVQTMAFTLGLPHEHAHPVDHVARAKVLERDGDREGAVAELRRAVYDEPGKTDSLEVLGRLSRRIGDFDVAVAAYERLEAEKPEDALPSIRLARIELTQHAASKAKASAEEALRRDPSSAEAQHLLGRAELSAGHLKQAIAAFQRATDLDPGHAWAFNNLGYAYLQAGEADKAAEALEEAVSIKSDSPSIWNNLGIAWERQGRNGDARQAFGKALEIKPSYLKAKINSDRASRVATAPEPVTDVPVTGGVQIDPGPTSGGEGSKLDLYEDDGDL